jgi:hypothetical protein
MLPHTRERPLAAKSAPVLDSRLTAVVKECDNQRRNWCSRFSSQEIESQFLITGHYGSDPSTGNNSCGHAVNFGLLTKRRTLRGSILKVIYPINGGDHD